MTMQTLWQDIRYGVRMLRKDAGLHGDCGGDVGAGDRGEYGAVFGGDPLPYHQPERLVAVYASSPQFRHSSISYPNFLDWRRENQSFEALAAFKADSVNLTGMGDPER